MSFVTFSTFSVTSVVKYFLTTENIKGDAEAHKELTIYSNKGILIAYFLIFFIVSIAAFLVVSLPATCGK